jgi:AraC-type DNA-binding domain-containing proteins
METINNLMHSDKMELCVYNCGHQTCVASYSYGPAVRDHYIIHYILRGKGNFYVGNQVYSLKQGDGFLICPDVLTFYQADSEDPWYYNWVGFNGLYVADYLQQAGLDQSHPVFSYLEDDFLKNCFQEMFATSKLTIGKEPRLLGQLYIFLSKLIETSSTREQLDIKENLKSLYVKKAIEFIKNNYSSKIGIKQLAEYLGFDRSYFFTIFKEQIHVSPQEFLIHYRLGKACDLMKRPLLSISDISRSVGYNDPLLFSKVFKKYKGQSPKEYRKNVIDLFECIEKASGNQLIEQHKNNF